MEFIGNLILPIEMVSEILTQLVFSGVKNPGTCWCLSRNIYKNWKAKFLDLPGDVPDNTTSVMFIKITDDYIWRDLRYYRLLQQAQYIYVGYSFGNYLSYGFLEFKSRNLKFIDCGGAKVGSIFINGPHTFNLYNYIYTPLKGEGEIVGKYFPESYELHRKFEEKYNHPCMYSGIEIASGKTILRIDEAFLCSEFTVDVLSIARHIIIVSCRWTDCLAETVMTRLSELDKLVSCVITTSHRQVYDNYVRLIKKYRLSNCQPIINSRFR